MSNYGILKTIREKTRELVAIHVLADSDYKWEDMCDDGAVYYMNGNDGTSFDWSANGRTCEFMIFWKETEYGAIKSFINEYGHMIAYVYPTPNTIHGTAVNTNVKFDIADVCDFVEWLESNMDDNDIFDAIINEDELF